jgi:hypothetical protein
MKEKNHRFTYRRLICSTGLVLLFSFSFFGRGGVVF